MRDTRANRELMTELLARSDAPPVRLRRAGVDDAPRIAALGARLFIQTYDGQMSPDDIAEYLRTTFGVAQQETELRAPDTAIWVAESTTGEATGYAMLRRRELPEQERSGDGIELARIQVDGEGQGHRLGATLLATCISEARAWGGDLLWLSVPERDARAIAFYHRLGLRVVGSRELMIGRDTQRDQLMALALR